MRLRVVALATFVLASACRAEDLDARLQSTRPHARAVDEQGRGDTAVGTAGSRLPLLRATNRRLTRKVYGYYPYWSSGWQNLRFELLSTLAYFASSLDENGNITGSNGWGGASVASLVAAAKRAGVRVVQTITLFDDAAIGRLLADATRRANAVTSIVAEVQRGGGEGCNIDFESVPLSARDDFVTFMTALTQRMHDAIPGSEVTIATPAVDWSGAYAYQRLSEATDGLMIMGYDYHWSGGPPGPSSPLRADAPWSGRSVSWTVADYLHYAGAQNRGKLILGLPFYGNDWPTTSDAVPGTSAGRARAVLYKDAVVAAQRYGRRWDTASGGTPYYVYRGADGGWHQTWYDDATSLGLKIDLINGNDLGGLGIWALGYDGARTELFDVIEAKLTEPIVADGGSDGGTDGGAGDGGSRDGGLVDAGVVDGGWRDGGALDGGARDGGSRDAGLPDAGVARDGGDALDGGLPSDGGTVGPPASGGCGVAAGACSGFGSTFFLMAGIALLQRFRRRAAKGRSRLRAGPPRALCSATE